jgi:hypothetical protein
MTLTRWKLLVGVLGLSMCGLAALAEPACRTVGYTARHTESTPDNTPANGSKPKAESEPPPLPVIPPNVASANSDVKPVPPQMQFPPLPTVPDAVPPAVDLSTRSMAIDPPLPAPATLPVPGSTDVKLLPLVDLNASEPTPTPLPPPEQTGALQLPLLPAGPTPPTTQPTPQPMLPPPLPPIEAPQPEPQPPIILLKPLDAESATPQNPTPPALDPFLVQPPLPADTAPKVTPLPPPTPETAPPPSIQGGIAPVEAVAKAKAQTKMKVQLNLGDDLPRFEVREWDEVVLKVTAKLVTVASDTNSKTGSLLTAIEGVEFMTLGYRGRCDELQVSPDRGEVQLSGNVQITSTWGKAETTATAEKMVFRLGKDQTNPTK